MPMPMPMPLPLNSTENKWSPYSSAKDFDENMVVILIVLVLATILAFSLPAAARLLLRLLRRRQKHRAQPPKPDGGPPATQLFSSAGGAGERVECAICLAEFADGDRVRVLPACSHGFHVACVGQWLVANSSCPTCRRSCRPADEP